MPTVGGLWDSGSLNHNKQYGNLKELPVESHDVFIRIGAKRLKEVSSNFTVEDIMIQINSCGLFSFWSSELGGLPTFIQIPFTVHTLTHMDPLKSINPPPQRQSWRCMPASPLISYPGAPYVSSL